MERCSGHHERLEDQADRDLVEIVLQARDAALAERAFAVLYCRHRGPVAAALRHRFRASFSADDLQDVVAEATCRVVRFLHRCLAAPEGAPGTLRRPEAFRAFYLRTAVRCALDVLRHRRRFVLEADVDDESTRPGLAERSGGPDVHALERRAVAVADLRRALAHLSPLQLRLLRLYYYEGYKVREIAFDLTLAEGHVKRTLFDARKRLRELLT